ncbi:uncharacterized protein FYW47_013455 [Aplochiton taeniatus]
MTECIYLYKNGQVIEGRGYEDRLCLVTQELEKGNVSLRLRGFRGSDVGVYICQVIHGEQEQETAVGLGTRTELELEKQMMKRLEEMSKKLTESEEELKEKDYILKKRETELQETEIKLKSTTSELSDLKTEMERLRKELSTWTVCCVAVGAESSAPDSPVSPSVSELRLVLLGRTGAGRSAAGNTILDREEFGAQASPSAESQRSRRREGEVCGRRLVLVDTPDWFCPGLSLEEMRQDVGLCLRLSAPGPHAFLLVIPVEPSEEEERGMMERMEEMFGEGCWGHTVILFTHADILTEQSIEEFLQAGSPDLQQLVEKCGNRFHVLNIKDGAQGTQVSKLLDQIEEMVSGNTESFYSTQTYQEAETQVREMERKIHREREERKQREEEAMKERIEKELQDSLNKMEVLIQEHEGDIRTLNHRTTELERQIKEEREDEKKRELERELKRESDRREEIETKLEKFREKRGKERREMEERHRQEMEEMRENYEGEAKVEAKNLTTVLCELQRNIMIAQNKMKREFSRHMEDKERQMQEKDRMLKEGNRQIETLTQNIKHLHDALSRLEETRVQRSLLGVLGWFRRNSSSWLLHSIGSSANPGLIEAVRDL